MISYNLPVLLRIVLFSRLLNAYCSVTEAIVQSQIEDMFGDAPDKMTYTEQANKRSHCRRLTSFIRLDMSVEFLFMNSPHYSRRLVYSPNMCPVHIFYCAHRRDRW